MSSKAISSSKQRQKYQRNHQSAINDATTTARRLRAPLPAARTPPARHCARMHRHALRRRNLRVTHRQTRSDAPPPRTRTPLRARAWRARHHGITHGTWMGGNGGKRRRACVTALYRARDLCNRAANGELCVRPAAARRTLPARLQTSPFLPRCAWRTLRRHRRRAVRADIVVGIYSGGGAVGHAYLPVRYWRTEQLGRDAICACLSCRASRTLTHRLPALPPTVPPATFLPAWRPAPSRPAVANLLCHRCLPALPYCALKNDGAAGYGGRYITRC